MSPPKLPWSNPLVNLARLGHSWRMWRFALILGLGGLAACEPDITCVDVGCAQGLVCDRVSGSCVEPQNDCRILDTCDANETCDQATGSCRPAEVKCADGNPCPTGLVCDGQSGICKPTFRCTVDGCAPAEICDSRSERCVPRPCSVDSECPDTHVCDQLTCRLGCRPGANTCAEGQSCLFQTGDTFGACQPDCTRDVDCPFGQECQVDATSSSCALEPPCDANEDCRPDEICTSSACVQPPCSNDNECLATQVCEIPTGTCLNAACVEDIYGKTVANHSRETAFALPPAAECPNTATPVCVYDDLTLCPGRSDWFSVRAQTNDVVRVRVEQVTQTPDVDLFVWDSNGALLGQNTLLDAVSTLRIAPNRDQVLYLEIRPTTYEGSTYALTVAREFCGNDAFEENDSLGDATVTSSAANTPSEIRARTCGLDEDWFVLRGLTPESGLTLERTVSDSALVVQVLSPDGETYDIPRGSPSRWLRLGVAGDYLVRAYSALGLNSDYRLAYTVTSEWACPGVGTAATPEGALEAAQGTSLWTLCPVADAWDIAHLNLPDVADGLLEIAVVPSPDAPPLNVGLFTNGAATRTAVWDGTAWLLSAQVSSADSHLLRVSSDSAGTRLRESPDFEVSWTVQE